jgi:hypothetical protein
MVTASRLTLVVLVLTTTLSGCAKKQPDPQVRLLSEQEAADLWNKAESRQPVGEAMVRRFPGEAGTHVTTTQAYALRMANGGGAGSLVTVCGGYCQVTTQGGTTAGCQTSGCVPSGHSCTPLVCSGNCSVSGACRAEATFGVFSGVFAQ